MDSIVAFNRDTLRSLNGTWIRRGDWESPPSCFNYGLPEYVFHLIDKPICDDITECDLICHFMSQFKHPVHYLEIGVSVGKTFFQILKYVQSLGLVGGKHTMSCLDIEQINPVLYDRLCENNGELHNERIPSNHVHGSVRDADYVDVSTWKYKNVDVTYFESDEFNKDIWPIMNSTHNIPYNVIFSDALHEPSALIEEYYNLKNNSMIDPEGFIYCFDDLEEDEDHGKMWAAVKQIHIDMSHHFVGVQLKHFTVNGWLGEHESKHHFGVLYYNVEVDVGAGAGAGAG